MELIMESNVNLKIEKDDFVVEVYNDTDLMLIEIKDNFGSCLTMDKDQYELIKNMVEKLIKTYDEF